jgi:uncharacterized small protein (TIGR04563 family)
LERLVRRRAKSSARDIRPLARRFVGRGHTKALKVRETATVFPDILDEPGDVGSARTQKGGKGQMDERDAKAKKQSLYFPQEMLEEIKSEALRLERSLSWVVQRAWRRAREEIKKTPAG